MMHNHNCSTCSKVTGIIRIILGAVLLYFGISKLGAGPEMIEFVGGAPHLLGLTFLSVTTWFWIATVGELFAGIALLIGFSTRLGAIIALVIMFFAFTATGWAVNNPMGIVTVLITAGLLYVLFQGSGAWALSPEGKCASHAHGDKHGGCCGGGCCGNKGAPHAHSVDEEMTTEEWTTEETTTEEWVGDDVVFEDEDEDQLPDENDKEKGVIEV